MLTTLHKTEENKHRSSLSLFNQMKWRRLCTLIRMFLIYSWMLVNMDAAASSANSAKRLRKRLLQTREEASLLCLHRTLILLCVKRSKFLKLHRFWNYFAGLRQLLSKLKIHYKVNKQEFVCANLSWHSFEMSM